MQPIRKKIESLASAINSAYDGLAIPEKKSRMIELQEVLSQPEVWNNPVRAQELQKDLSAISSVVDDWETIRTQISDIQELFALDEDESMQHEFERQIDAIEMTYSALKKQLQYTGPYDSGNAIVRLSAGVGGTDAQDWTEMLERMYLRWAERSGMKATIVDVSKGEEAGIKSATIEITGPFVYGKLKGEHGVHRLVRLSPFNSDNLRQTSFALVEVMPQIDTPDEAVIDDKDLKIDVYRAGGHGGQSVNTTDSAVRITHIPTGIVVAIQNERSQLQNKETALKILRSKLTQLRLEQHTDTISELRAGESANWGSQIRNYILHPYSLVKDTRTKYEETNTQAVLDGEIDGFIDAFADSSYDK